MFLSKLNIKDLVKILFGFNIICLVSYFILNYFNIVSLSKTNLFYLLIFTFLFICIFMNKKYYDEKAGYFFCSIVFMGQIFFLIQIFFKLGRNFIE